MIQMVDRRRETDLLSSSPNKRSEAKVGRAGRGIRIRRREEIERSRKMHAQAGVLDLVF